jgi:hypothetical protein
MSYGLRYENDSIVHDVNNFGPRAAIAYDPFKTGKTVIRAGAGSFTTARYCGTIDDFTLGAQQRFFDTNALVDPATARLMTATQRRAFIAANSSLPANAVPPIPPGQTIWSVEFRILTPPGSEFKYSGKLPNQCRRGTPDWQAPGLRSELHMESRLTSLARIQRERAAPAERLRQFYGLSRFADFANFLSGAGGVRPLLNTSTAGDLVRFVLVPPDPANPNSVIRVIEFGVPVSLINLNAFTSTTSVDAALAALNSLRPDPSQGEIEQLIPVGNSQYHGLTLELRHRFVPHGTAPVFHSERSTHFLF